MFDRVGGKIQTFAKVIFYIQVTISIIGAVVSAAYVHYLVGLFIIVIGPIYAWIISAILYGFGLLVESAVGIERNTRLNQSQWMKDRIDNFSEYQKFAP